MGKKKKRETTTISQVVGLNVPTARPAVPYARGVQQRERYFQEGAYQLHPLVADAEARRELASAVKVLRETSGRKNGLSREAAERLALRHRSLQDYVRGTGGRTLRRRVILVSEVKKYNSINIPTTEEHITRASARLKEDCVAAIKAERQGDPHKSPKQRVERAQHQIYYSPKATFQRVAGSAASSAVFAGVLEVGRQGWQWKQTGKKPCWKQVLKTAVIAAGIGAAFSGGEALSYWGLLKMGVLAGTAAKGAGVLSGFAACGFDVWQELAAVRAQESTVEEALLHGGLKVITNIGCSVLSAAFPGIGTLASAVIQGGVRWFSSWLRRQPVAPAQQVPCAA